MMTPYKKADEALVILSSDIKKEFNRHKLRNFLPLDEVNIIRLKKNTESLYKRLDEQNRDFYLKIAQDAYAAACEEIGASKGSGLTAAFIESMLDSVDEVTQYIYTNEVERKRDRFFENLLVLSVSGYSESDLMQTYRKAVRLWLQQTEQYEINVVDRARRQAFDDNDIDEVIWNTQQDGKVCAECEERDGVVYDADDIPARHYRCRCYLTAVD